MNTVFVQLYETIWKSIFPGMTAITLDNAKELFTPDMHIPVSHACYKSGVPVFSSPEDVYSRYISQDEEMKRMNVDNFMNEKRSFESFSDVLIYMKDFASFRGSRVTNSDIVEDSDMIFSSSYIYNSLHLYNCQKMMYCFNSKTSEYMFASKGNADSSFGIRITDSAGVSNSFDVSCSAKCANCYFCHNSYNLRDCMFCFHLNSKQHCIGNIQYTEDEYKKLKEMILKGYFEQLPSGNAFISLRSI